MGFEAKELEQTHDQDGVNVVKGSATRCSENLKRSSLNLKRAETVDIQ